MKQFLSVLCALAILASLCAAAAAQEAPLGGVIVEPNPDSATGYTATFTYYDSQATNVRILGGFQFYVENDPNCYAKGFNLPEGETIDDYLYNPQEWQKGLNLCHVFDDNYSDDMIYDQNLGAWTYSLDLPCASYLYQYSVSYDNGETYSSICDPANVPYVNSLGAGQTRSQFFVPYDAEKQDTADDWTWLFPMEDEQAKGQIVYQTYIALDGSQAPLMIYLPAHYDAQREIPYKVLYLSHGGGGEEGDWFHQANAHNILDRLMAQGDCEEFIVVCMDNASIDNWDWDKIFETTRDLIIPYMEENYNVSTQVADRAYAGLSQGAKTTGEIYYRDPSLFGYFGFFSGSAAWDWPQLEDYTAMQAPDIYLACGWADHLYMHETYHTDEDKTIIGFAELLDAAGIEYNDGNGYVVVQGGHDWFTWPQILRDYVTTTLWK